MLTRYDEMIYNIQRHMRYPATHKDDTRDRILRAASRRFRRDGREGTAIGGLMSDLRMTHGGFYRHFRGKDELFDEALAQATREVSLRLEQAALAVSAARRATAIIDAYLSMEHCGNRPGGCPLAALASDLGRAGESPRSPAFESAMREHMARMANYLPGATPEARLRDADVLFSGMAGTLAMSRAVADSAQRAELLRSARQFYKRALGV